MDVPPQYTCADKGKSGKPLDGGLGGKDGNIDGTNHLWYPPSKYPLLQITWQVPVIIG